MIIEIPPLPFGLCHSTGGWWRNGKNRFKNINLSPLKNNRAIHLLHVPESHYLGLLYNVQAEDLVQHQLKKAKKHGRHTKKSKSQPVKVFAVEDSYKELILSSDSEPG
jgi:hypothetical protein